MSTRTGTEAVEMVTVNREVADAVVHELRTTQKIQGVEQFAHRMDQLVSAEYRSRIWQYVRIDPDTQEVNCDHALRAIQDTLTNGAINSTSPHVRSLAQVQRDTALGLIEFLSYLDPEAALKATVSPTAYEHLKE